MPPGNTPAAQPGGGGAGGGVMVTLTDPCTPPPNAVAVTVVPPTPSAMTAPVVADAARTEAIAGFADCHVKEMPGIGAPRISSACALSPRPPFIGIVAPTGAITTDATAGSALIWKLS